MVKSEGRVVLLQSKIKIKEKGTDKREEIEQEKEKKKICKSIDKRYTLQYESLAPLSPRFSFSLLRSQENQALNSNDRS